MLGLALVCGVLLSTTYHLSEDKIEANQLAFEAAQLREVVGDPSVNLQGGGQYYQLQMAGAPYGELKTVTTNEGYNGTIRFWLATKHSGEVLGVRVIRHQETPGLGDKLELAVSDWVLGFNKTSLQKNAWDVKKYGGDFDQFSGATITPRAVVLASKAELEKQTAQSDKQAQSGKQAQSNAL
jgi:electron transport complex protein RnfG